MGKHTEQAATEKQSSEVLIKHENSITREKLGSVAETAEKQKTEKHLHTLGEEVKIISRKKSIERKEQVDYQFQIREWAKKYKTVDQNGIEDVLCKPFSKNAFFWRAEKTEDSVDQDPILEIREDELVYFLNGNIEGQRVFTFEQFDDVLKGRKIECCTAVDYAKIKNESIEIQYEQDCECAQRTCQKHTDICYQIPGKPENQINVKQVPGMVISPVIVENGLYTGECSIGCLDGKFALPEAEFEAIITEIESCPEEKGGQKIELGKVEYNTLGHDEFCEVECGEDCRELGDHTVSLENEMFEECDEDGIFMDEIEDETLESLEAKLKALKNEKKLNKKDLSNKERIAFLSALTGGTLVGASIADALMRNGSNNVVVRDVMSRIKGVKMRRKAEREMLGMDKKEYRAFRKERRKAIKSAKKEAKDTFKETHSGKEWRQKRRGEKKAEKEMQKINKKDIRADIKDTKKQIKELKKSAPKNRDLKKELRAERKAEKKEKRDE